MNAAEIYTHVKEKEEKKFTALFNTLTEKETQMFNRLVNMGDNKNVALWTVIAERYNPANGNEEFYINAYI